MTHLLPILAMAAAVYALRLTGLALPSLGSPLPRERLGAKATGGRGWGLPSPPAWERALTFLPVALLTALVVSGLAARTDGGTTPVIAAAGAAFVAYRTRRMWACIVGGMAIYWLLQLTPLA